MLFTGDAFELTNGIEKNDQLERCQKIHVDVLKVPHHGSQVTTVPSYFTMLVLQYTLLVVVHQHMATQPSNFST